MMSLKKKKIKYLKFQDPTGSGPGKYSLGPEPVHFVTNECDRFQSDIYIKYLAPHWFIFCSNDENNLTSFCIHITSFLINSVTSAHHHQILNNSRYTVSSIQYRSLQLEQIHLNIHIILIIQYTLLYT